MRVFVGALVGLVLLAGCSSSTGTQASPLPTAARESTLPTEPTTSTTVPPPWTPVNTWQFHGSKADGSTASVTVGFGTPAKSDSVASLPGLTTSVLDQCSFDPSRDLAIPGMISLQSTTAGFTGDFEFHLLLVRDGTEDTTLNTSDGTDTIVRAVTQFSDGAYCDGFQKGDVSSEFSVTFNTVQPDSTSVQYFYVILKGYFSPASPSGDQNLLNHLWFGPNFASDPTTARGLNPSTSLYADSASGPGMMLLQRLSPSAPPWPNTWAFSPLGAQADPATLANTYVPMP